MRSYNSARRGGKVYFFGASSAVKGDKRSLISAVRMWFNTPKFDPIKMMSSNKSVFGVHMGLLDDEKIFASHLNALSKMLENNQINPIIDSIWRFENVAEAQMHMHNRKNRGKILLDFAPE